MAKEKRPKKTLGQTLVDQIKRDLIVTSQACLMFINQVTLEAIPTEVESLPPEFRAELVDYLKGLPIGSPGWDESLLIGGLYYWGDVTPEEQTARYQAIARKNRITAEALWAHFQSGQSNTPEIK
jgi:hypothetical protein